MQIKLPYLVIMIFEEKIALAALKYITGETDNVCRLCFAITDCREAVIENNVKVKTSYCDDNVSIATMFRDLGVSTEPQLPQVLCAKCSTNTVNAYLFHKLCQFSEDNWSSILNRLSECLTQSDLVSSSTQSIYWIISKEDNHMFTSRKHNSCSSKNSALRKVKEIIKNRLKYIKVKQAVIDTICEECGERFTTSLELIKHLKTHSKSQNPCLKCPKIFSSPFLLEKHEERVHYPKKLQCSKCPKKFSTKTILNIHERTFHCTAICKFCYKKFPSKKELRYHVDSHETNICQRCGKKFKNKQTFKIHLETCGNSQDNQTKYFCDICGKGYIRKNSIRTHLRIDHGFGNVLSCSWCNKKFDAISRLRNHIVKHTKEKKFHCGQCGGKFVTQAALIYHTRLHTGERPFHCDLCDERFLNASRRAEHRRRKHFGPTEKCHVCHVKFFTSHQLRKHVERHYNPHSKLFVSEDGIKMGNLLPVT